jgi:hypothetical protein
VVFEHDHAGLWVHAFEDQRLPISVSVGNHGGHHGALVMVWAKAWAGARVPGVTQASVVAGHGRPYSNSSIPKIERCKQETAAA